MRALFPMYETAQAQVVALRSSGITSVRALAGKRVGVGPADGPSDIYFKGLADSLGIAYTPAISPGAPLTLGWNFMMAHKDLPEADAYWITRTVLSTADPASIHPLAAPTRTANAVYNTTVPFHPGALKFYAEQGVTGLK